MPSLEFKGKAFVYAHHLTVPFRELVPDGGKSCLPKGAAPALDGNLIIHGDNLHALKALLPLYAGKVDCVFIDPPYNTGNEGWRYNDNVRSPVAKEWLKKNGPVDREDLERHDKWACMMWPRLKLLHELLADCGVLLLAIDDNEHARLKLMLDEIFSANGFVANFVWQRRIGSSMAKDWVSTDHESVLVFAKQPSSVAVHGAERDMTKYSIADGSGRFYASMPLTVGMTKEMRPNQWYELKNPRTGKGYWPPMGRVWGYIPSTMANKIEEQLIIWPDDYPDRKMTAPRLKTYPEDAKRDRKPISTWLDSTGRTEEGTVVLRELFGDNVFPYPKPLSLLMFIVEQFTGPDALIVDSFAGSGTTAHAVLAQNKKDGGNRRFILVEGENYADTLTAERVRRVIHGYAFTGSKRTELMREPLNWTKLKKADALVEKAESIKQLEGADYDDVKIAVEAGELVVTGEMKIKEKAPGLGGAFTYCTLGAEMSLEGLLTGKDLPAFEALAKYVFYTATGRTLTTVAKQTKAGNGFIGEVEHYRVHLLYEPDQTWLRSEAGVLTETRVEAIVAARGAGQRSLVFAAAKYLSQKDLTARGVEFCQLPYAIHRILGESSAAHA